MERKFENVNINIATLKDSILDSISAELRAKYIGVSYSDNTLVVYFTEDLTPGAIIDLGNIIASHDDAIEKPYYLVYDLVPNKENYNIYEPPLDIDFTINLIQTLHKKTLPKTHGKPTSVEYYKNYNNGNYTGIVTRRDFVLTYDSGGFITEKQDMIGWYMSDGSLSPIRKNIGKKFDPILDMEARIKEGKARRGSIIDGLQLPVLAGLIETQPLLEGETPVEKQQRMILIGRAFLLEYFTAFQNLIDHSDKSVIQTIWDEDRYPWLDSPVPSWGGFTIRGYILNELNY